MIEYREIPESDMIELMVDGYISADEFHSVLEKIEPFMQQHKKVRALKEVRSFTGMDFGVFKDRLLGTWLKHYKDISGAALVCDEQWMLQLSNLIKPMFPYPVRCFKLDQIEEARAWLKSI